MGKKCIGIDVGGTSVKIGLFEIDGTLVDKWEVKTRKEEQGKYILEDVAASIKERLDPAHSWLSRARQIHGGQTVYRWPPSSFWLLSRCP